MGEEGAQRGGVSMKLPSVLAQRLGRLTQSRQEAPATILVFFQAHVYPQ